MPSSADPFLRQRTVALTDGSAWRAFLRRWGISLASLASGLVTLLIFRRGVPHVGWIVGYVVGLWLLFAVLSQARDALLAGGRRLVVAAGDYTIQTLYHGLLLFVLPGYFASTTFDGITVVFFVVLAAAALLTTVDPWYRALVHPRPWLGLAFFGFSLFAGLNVALPLVGVPPAAAVVLSAALGALGLTPTFFRRAGRWAPAAARAGALALLAVGAAWLARPAVPPAPVSLVRPTLARAVADLAPVEPVARISLSELRAWGGLTRVHAGGGPRGAPPGDRAPVAPRGARGLDGAARDAGAGRSGGRLPHVLPEGGLPARCPGALDGGRGDRVRPADRPPAVPRGRVTVLFDTHAHLHDPAFDADRAAVIARARAAGVTGFLTIGTDEATSVAAVALAAAEPDVYAAVGIHPHDAGTASPATLERIAALARAPRVVAIGEIGLDYYRDLSPRAAQREALVAQLRLARAVGKPVLLHCREAHADLLDVCEAEGVAAVGGILHCFSGDLEVARRGLDLGLLISIAGPVTYPSARRLAEVVRALPLDRLVVETDCPYLPPQPWRGQRNEPAYLPTTAARVAELLGLPIATVAAATSGNAARLLALPPPRPGPAAPPA